MSVHPLKRQKSDPPPKLAEKSSIFIAYHGPDNPRLELRCSVNNQADCQKLIDILRIMADALSVGQPAYEIPMPKYEWTAPSPASEEG